MAGLSKLMFAVRAKPGLTREQALAHLRERHAPLVAASTTNRQRLKTYIQNHAMDAAGVPGLTRDRDWIIESWRAPDVVLPEPPVAPDAIALREDEARFPDRATLLTLQVVEEPVWIADPTAPFAAAPVKLFTYGQRKAGADKATFALLWTEAAERLAAHPAFRRCAASFIRNRPVPGMGAPVTVTAAPSAALEPPYDAVDIWRFPDAMTMVRLFEDAAFAEAVRLYEAQLFAGGSLFRLATVENRVFDDGRIDPANRA